MSDLKSLTRHKWRSILGNFIDDFFLDGQHHPCPLCGGEDRFRFSNLDGGGSYYCNQCGAGSAVHLIAEFLHIDHKAAWQKIKEVLPDAVESDAPKADADRSKMIEKILKTAAPIAQGDEVWNYLRSRGIANPASDLKIRKAADGTTMMIGQFAKGVKRAGIHVTFLKDGRKIEGSTAKKMIGLERGGLVGSAVRLHKLNGSTKLVVAEGIETALSAAELFERPAWACGAAPLMEKLEVPDVVTDVLIAGDSDESFTGQAAAYILAKRLRLKGKTVTIALPNKLGTDWNDVLQEKNRR